MRVDVSDVAVNVCAEVFTGTSVCGSLGMMSWSGVDESTAGVQAAP